LLTIVNSRRLFAVLFFSRAISMMRFTTGKLTSGSPPWNSRVTLSFVVAKIFSIGLLGDRLAHVGVAWRSCPAREAWQ